MRTQLSGIKRLTSLFLIGGGLYLLMHFFMLASLPKPKIDIGLYNTNVDINTKILQISNENRLYIPKISVDVEIVSGNISSLEKGAWHRKPENGNPIVGSNFVLSAHRFEMGWTPQQTRTKSPFYHIDKLEAGDIIFVDYQQKRYQYVVTKKYHVDRNATHIESPSNEHKLTLYSCDLRGEADGREVVEAIRISEL